MNKTNLYNLAESKVYNVTSIIGFGDPTTSYNHPPIHYVAPGIYLYVVAPRNVVKIWDLTYLGLGEDW